MSNEQVNDIKRKSDNTGTGNANKATLYYNPTVF